MDLGIKGKKAIVCASSKGLGKACAEFLAADGVDVVLTARGADALNKTADEIRSKYQVKVTAIPLPENIRDLLQENTALTKRIFVDKSVSLEGESDAVEFRKKLREEFTKAGWEREWEHLL